MSNNVDVLIIDDQPGVRRLLLEALAEEGLAVKAAGSGAEGLQMLAACRPYLVLLDMKMPGMNGVETLQEIRRHDMTLPVVMMSAYGDLEVMEQTRHLEVTHYLSKPFDLDEVRLLVRTVLAERLPVKGRQADIG
ncbi:response regulator [Desulforamulus hydrothermalis]|uniref:Stage 0 sporulation protein A homolog n=1 Tax=Desulforamulus hydrothermalis Lam5 = DSM 18033 TaxID=1121428 RepID=K8DZC1_9FIRM|nr:response regulator [Desulforamulus hydrothermalis]CCO08407.1 Sporulation initiation phosphotransferase F [Desulforamulus hydrothermalis Lam5 = DSM 18033]SHH14761.1 two-component system, response regulator, stage 0 sporulation protein F [Desulforamulus hydrothermalis Lam5 = DSM 18033]